MKKFYTFISAVLISATLWAQAPQSFSYQAVVRSANNELVVNKPVGMKISLLQGSENGPVAYTETHTPTSNANGLVSIAIGAGTKVTGNFATIDWSKGPYFVKTETDPTGEISYTLTSVSQLLSVPYALYARNGMANGDYVGQMNYWDGKSWLQISKGTDSSRLVLENGIPTWKKDSYNYTGSLGKSNIYISGDLSNVEAQNIINKDCGANTQRITITGTKNITDLIFPTLSDLISIDISNNNKLNSVIFKSLKTVLSNITISGNNNLKLVELNELINVEGILELYVDEKCNLEIKGVKTKKIQTLNANRDRFYQSNSADTNRIIFLNFPLLESCNLTIGSEIKEINFPNLNSGSLTSYSNNIESIELPNLINAERVIIQGEKVKKVNLSGLKTIGNGEVFLNFGIFNSPKLTDLKIGRLTSLIDIRADFSGCALSSLIINDILSNLNAITPSLKNIQIDLSNQNPKAPPTGQGLIDKNTLIQNGNDVITD
jgi:hypothetical protein